MSAPDPETVNVPPLDEVDPLLPTEPTSVFCQPLGSEDAVAVTAT